MSGVRLKTETISPSRARRAGINNHDIPHMVTVTITVANGLNTNGIAVLITTCVALSEQSEEVNKQTKESACPL